MKHKIFIALLLLVFAISACAPLSPGDTVSLSGTDAPRAWFDEPLPETVFWPPNPCRIVAHGASPNGIAVFELTINGTATSVPSPDGASSLITLTRDCGLTNPGRYVLLLRAQDNTGNWSGYAETSVIIGGRDQPTNALPTNPPLATIPVDIVTFPAVTPSVPPASIVIEEITTGLVYLGASSCGPVDVTITARAIAPDGITVVVLFYRFFTGNSSSDFQSVSMSPIGSDLYQRTLNPTSLLGGVISFDMATLQYQVVIQQTNGDTTIRTPVLADIAVQACGRVTSACSTYTTRESCLSHGCRWVGGGTTFTCQNP